MTWTGNVASGTSAGSSYHHIRFVFDQGVLPEDEMRRILRQAAEDLQRQFGYVPPPPPTCGDTRTKADKIRDLAERAATPGEREAALEALRRLE